MIAVCKRLGWGLTTIAVFFVPLLTFLLSVFALHKSEVVAVVLIRTPAGLRELLVLFLTAALPTVSAILAGRNSGRLRSFRTFVVVLAGSLTLFYAVAIVLLGFRLQTGIPLDPSIIWFHFSDTVRTLIVLANEYHPLLIAASLLLLLHFFGFARKLSIGWDGNSLRDESREGRLLFFCCVILMTTSQWFADNGIRNLVMESRRGKSVAKSLYLRYFDDSVRRSQIRPTAIALDSDPQNIFIVQLESVNALLINNDFTPRFLNIVKENGVLFPRIQASSVFTVLSMESIFCGTLPTLESNLAVVPALHSQLHCLPRLFKEKGYRTLYFQSYPDLQFNNMGPFFHAIGFDETHAGDVMQAGDAELKWGYADDIFYQRVFEYLETRRNEKLFVYILPGSTNHYPFYDQQVGESFPDTKRFLPYQLPGSVREQMANTMFLQDRFFGEMYDKYYKTSFAHNSDMFVLGDHSWPIEVHPGNRNNLNGAFQENFVTAMGFLPRRNMADKNHFLRGRVVDTLYSYIDLLATMADLYATQPHTFYGRSFAHELTDSSRIDHSQRRCVVSVQPFSGSAIVVINYPKKLLFDLRNDRVTLYNLDKDPDELSPVESRALDAESIGELEKCLKANVPTVRSLNSAN